MSAKSTVPGDVSANVKLAVGGAGNEDDSLPVYVPASRPIEPPHGVLLTRLVLLYDALIAVAKRFDWTVPDFVTLSRIV